MNCRSVVAVGILALTGLAVSSARAWGPGHDTVGLAVLEKVGPKWESRLKAVDRRRFLSATHLPDNGNPALFGEGCRAYLASRGMGKTTFKLHNPPLRMALFNALVAAMVEDRDEDVAIVTAALSHALADPYACNHDPIAHYATYIISPGGLDVVPSLSLDFRFAGEEKTTLARRLAELEELPLPADLTPADVYRQMVRWDVEADDLNFSHGRKVVDAELAYRATKTPENAAKLADILCDLGLAAVQHTIWCFRAAERFAAAGKPLPDADFAALAAAYEREFNPIRAARDARNDAFAADCLPEPGRKYEAAVLYDPLGHMASGVLSPYARLAAVQCVHSLRAMGRRAALLDVREARKGIDSSATPTLIVFGRRFAGWAGFDAGALKSAIARYAKEGGRIVWIDGGINPGVCDGLRPALKEAEKKDGYCDPRYPVALDELVRSELAWTGAGGERSWRCRRRPNGKAGWMWDGSRWWFDPAKLPTDAKPVLELRTPDHGAFVQGVTLGNFTYLPLAAIFPYVFTDEKPDLANGLALRLDSCGEEILRRILAGIGRTSASAAPVALEMVRGKPGEAKPLGWLKAWGRLAADGYAGCMDDVDPEFARAWAAEFRPRGEKLDWMAAPNGSWSAEGGAYWFDGLVRLAEQMDDPGLRELARKRLEPVIANMNAKSVLFNWWLDRDSDEERGWCYRSPAVWQMWAGGISERALAAYLDVTGDMRAKRALAFAFDDPRLFTEATVRKAPAAQAVFEAAWLTDDPGVRRTADAAARDPMPAFSVPPAADLDASLDWKRPEIRKARATRHGVTTAEALLSVLRAYRWSGERKYLDAVLAWFAFLDSRALQPYGVTVSDEEWGWAGARRGSETCTVAAEPWTRTELMMLLGDGRWGDAVERAFFNAAPNCVSRDFRSHVYLQTPNRTDANDFSEVSAYRDFIGIKACPTRFARKHYPLCCTAALNRLIPNYVQSMWMKSADGGVVAALYGPSSFATDLPSGRVALRETTDYPFAEAIRIEVRSAPSAPFALKLRIPGWCAAPAATLNGAPLELRAVRGFASVARAWRAGDEVTLRLPMRPELTTLEDRNENGRLRASVSHGPLLYAFALPEADENTPQAGWTEPTLGAHSLEGAEVVRAPLSRGWGWSREAPVRLKVRDSGGKPLELVPYGCAKLRISLFPMATLDTQVRGR